MILSRVMLDQNQKHELIEQVIAAQLKKYTPEVIQKSYEEYAYNDYDGDTQALIEDAVEYKVITKDEADSFYSL
jgi:5-formyltetrahydrofolate cyclo-ligase